MRKSILVCCVVAVLALCAGAVGAATENPADQIVAERLRKASDQLRTAHDQLQDMREEVERVRRVATVNFQNNAYKVFMKGVLDVYGRVTAPGGWVDAVNMAVETVQNLWSDPTLFGSMVRKPGSEQRALLSAGAENALRSRGRVRRYLHDLAVIMQSPLARFDDDQPPLRSAKGWWRYPGDGVTDDEIELVTRKLQVVRNLSEKLVSVMDRELASLREQRKNMLAVIAELEAAKPASKQSGTADRAYLESLMPLPGDIPMPPSTAPDKEPTKEWGISDGNAFPNYDPKDKYTGFEELTWRYSTSLQYPADPDEQYDYDVYVLLMRGDPAAIAKAYDEGVAFIASMGDMDKGYKPIQELDIGERGHIREATRDGGWNHSIMFRKKGILVEVRSSPWAGGLDVGKQAARAVAARIR
ncbi:hypothetical protein SAMN02745704_00575 [Paucidesulfovibrio gracilis DSM 16080]|uniref:Uncharacterized protein n=1 Tax=Paucidesulfovibrio gracilis DSM 16080 TaxID=1121449 RepID=A0A1T4W9R4_9BACT|nr:hypothetical protein [Paucidesulfovibrio gracilis]SKA74020.1 hypothetical protein SAMN02745704_00575 [Paucidesulfovibrio gracilis DSM 16080]